MTIPPVPNDDLPEAGITDVAPVPGKDEPEPGLVPPDSTPPPPVTGTTDI